MVKERAALIRKLLIVLDVVIVSGAFFIGYFLRNAIHDIYPINAYIGLLPLFVVIWGLSLHYFDMYNSTRFKKVPEILFSIFKIIPVNIIIFGGLSYIFKVPHLLSTVATVPYHL